MKDASDKTQNYLVMTIATINAKLKNIPRLDQVLAHIDLAQNMHHSHKTAPAYVRNLALDEGDAPPVKRGRGRPKSIKP